jgi:putative transposase
VPKRRVLNVLGYPHFLTFSTYQRRRFLDSPQTRDIVIRALQQVIDSQKATCTGFVIMPNHVHAIIFGGETFDISAFVQVWKKISSYRIRKFFTQELKRYQQLCPEDCPIWQAGFYDFNIDSDEKLNEKLEYMHNNPVEARLSDYALLWAWSSARFYELDEPVGVTITPLR